MQIISENAFVDENGFLAFGAVIVEGCPAVAERLEIIVHNGDGVVPDLLPDVAVHDGRSLDDGVCFAGVTDCFVRKDAAETVINDGRECSSGCMFCGEECLCHAHDFLG